jgi:alkaline phosphatase D
MKGISRRSFIKAAGATPLLFSLGASKSLSAAELKSDTPEPLEPKRSAKEISNPKAFVPGYLSILQGPTSKTEALFNLFAPRLKKYTYEVTDSNGSKLPSEHYSIVKGPGLYNIDKVRVKGLSVGTRYTLRVIDGKTTVDERTFGALDTDKANPHFALVACMCDDYRFNEVIDPMWERLRAESPDFIILNGDTVYVDSFEFVERKKATEFDLWQRYTDALKRIPLYHWKNLVPVFSTWDDHDFGTNDGDRDFVSRDAAGKLFNAMYLGADVGDTWARGPGGVSSVLYAFGQRFYFMDDRTFRQPNKDQVTAEPYGHWGREQHQWLLNDLARNDKPAWIINGNQCFNGVTLSFKECFEGNNPVEFTNFIEELKKIKAPVVFGSGDVHLSEIQRVPKDRFGYETYEFTSSSMHSFAGDGWENPARVAGAYCKEFNFLTLKAKAANKALQIDVKCLGLQAEPYFEKSFTVKV